jgi:Fe-S cluster assembly iron-binding protein IscA
VLALTPQAVEIIRSIVDASDSADSAGLRIAEAERDDSRGRQLAVSIEDAPIEGDEVVVEEDVQVFLENRVATYLDGRTLDAELDERTGQVRFLVE